MKKPVDYDELYPGRFIKAGMLGDRKPTLTIADVDVEELEGEKGKAIKAIISFEGKSAKWVVPKTNGLCLKAMFGKRLPDWVGKRVTLFKSRWGSDDCIRVWGSPDITEDFDVDIKLPRRKTFTMTMHKTGNGAAPDAGEMREPGMEG